MVCSSCGSNPQGVNSNISGYECSILLYHSIQLRMQMRRREELGGFSQKIRSEELAIANEIAGYKLNYLSKAVQSDALDNFARFARELHLLVVSHCKNIIYVAPETLPTAIDELTVLFEDLLRKYQDIAARYHQKSAEESVQQPKGHSLSELCAVCGQQFKKVSVDKMKSCLLNEMHLNGLQSYQESESEGEDEDAQFFEEVNNLLTLKQGELAKNQQEINNYKEVALNALTYLTALKDQFTRDSLLLPSNAWVGSAKKEMQAVLVETFQGKIPSWIAKMLTAFITHYQKEVEKKRCEVGTQTDSQNQLEITELRKKVFLAKEKLQAEQNLLRIQEKELTLVRGEKGNLECKIDYYKRELNKLIDEIENAKMENQILKMKLSNSKFSQGLDKNDTEKGSNNDSTHEIPRDQIMDSRRTQKMRSKLNPNEDGNERILPKIKGKSQSKNSEHKIRTSIKVKDISNQSHTRLETKKSTKRMEKATEAIINNGVKNDQILVSLKDTLENADKTVTERKGKKHSNELTDYSSLPKSVIKEQFGELSMQDYKVKIKEVDEQLKTAVKQGIFLKNGPKQFFSSMSQHCELKRVPRTTLKAEDSVTSKTSQHMDSELQSKNNSSSNGNLLRLSKIYSYLKDSGYLIKISEEQFKDSLIKIKIFETDADFGESTADHSKRGTFKSRKYIFEQGSLLKKSLNQEQSCNDTKITNSCQTSFDKTSASNYLMLFVSMQNSYLYETNMTKNHCNGAGRLGIAEQHLCQQFYDLINLVKLGNPQQYRVICSFIRFPYQIMSNSLGSMNIGNEMKYNTFEYYFQRILALHQKCKKQDSICQHLREFKNKLNQVMAPNK